VVSISLDSVFLMGKAGGINFSYRLCRFGVQIGADGDALTSALLLAVRLMHDACAHKSRRHSHCESTLQSVHHCNRKQPKQRELFCLSSASHTDQLYLLQLSATVSLAWSLWQHLGEGNSIQVWPDVTTNTLLVFHTLTFSSKG